MTPAHEVSVFIAIRNGARWLCTSGKLKIAPLVAAPDDWPLGGFFIMISSTRDWIASDCGR